MTLQIDLPPDAEAQLQAQAARAGQEPAEYLTQLVQQQLMLAALEALKDRKRPSSLDELQPRRPSPPGTSWLAQVAGKWPGDETDEQILKALEELS